MEVVLRRSLLQKNHPWLIPSKFLVFSLMASTKPWTTDPISLQKKELRKEITTRLAQMTPEDTEKQSALVTEKVLSSPWFKNAQRISVYVHTSGEIQTDKIIEESLKGGKDVFLPQFLRGNPNMRLLQVPSYKEFAEMEPTLWGIRQPKKDVNWKDYEESGPLDLVIMPGVGFTTNGDRLGHGMGYYDRMLANHQKQFGKMPARYALALTQQIVDKVPLGSTDVPLNGVIRAE